MVGGYMRESTWPRVARGQGRVGWGVVGLGALLELIGGGPWGLATCASWRAAPGGGRGGGQSRSTGVVGGEGQGAALSRVARAGAAAGAIRSVGCETRVENAKTAPPLVYG